MNQVLGTLCLCGRHGRSSWLPALNQLSPKSSSHSGQQFYHCIGLLLPSLHLVTALMVTSGNSVPAGVPLHPLTPPGSLMAWVLPVLMASSLAWPISPSLILTIQPPVPAYAVGYCSQSHMAIPTVPNLM